MQITRYTEDTDTQVIERTDGQSYIEGYAVRWYDGTPGTEFQLGPNRVERIVRSAFDGILNDPNEDTKCRFNHSREWTLGDKSTGLVLRSDEYGVRYRLPYDPADPQHQVVRSKRQKNLITGSSFKADVKYRWKRENDKDVAEVVDVARLYDVGPCDKAAYASTTAVVRAEDTDEYKQFLAQQETDKRLEQLKNLV